jgi:MFS family permease
MGRATRTPYRVTFLVLVSAVMAYALLQSLVVPALPTIQADLHTTQNATTWLITGYLLSASVCTPILGRIGDVFGKERMLVVTLGALGAGTALAAVSNSIGLLIIARLIQGAGGGVLPLAFGIIRDEFPRERVAGAIGLAAAMIAVGSGLGITVAGPIVSHLNYHWLFIIPLLLIIPAAIATHLLVPESPVQTAGGVSVRGALLLSGWLVALLLGISQGSSWGWLSVKTDALFVLAAVIAAGWVRAESRAKAPLIDMQMMRLPAVWPLTSPRCCSGSRCTP